MQLFEDKIARTDRALRVCGARGQIAKRISQRH
jgi:hypothetical protein